MFLRRVLWIRRAVFIFRASYMKGSKRYKGFHVLVRLFVSSIVLLIISPNLFSALIGWDGLGMISYLLVVFYGSSKAFNSGIITALSNRVGDILLLSRLGVVATAGSRDFFFFSGYGSWGRYLLLVGVGATTKRAQVPFSAWLPAAIAAPTPVSALVHSSTLVTAGVYLLIRHEVLLGVCKNYLIGVSLVTTWAARLMALFETDIKKIVALSTLRQLGLIITIVRVGQKELAFLHLLAHAFFKAMTFIATGAVIHSNSGFQDIRWGNTFRHFFLGFRAIRIASLRLAGVPFISAFFTKELLIEYMMLRSSPLWLLTLFFRSISLSAGYRVRLLYLILLKFPGLEVVSYRKDEDLKVLTAIFLLVIPSGLGGWCFARGAATTLWAGESYFIRKIVVLSLVFLGGGLGIVSPFRAYFRHLMWGLRSLSSKLRKRRKYPLQLVLTRERGICSRIVPSELRQVGLKIELLLPRGRGISFLGAVLPFLVLRAVLVF